MLDGISVSGLTRDAFEFIRRITGDDAYERYVSHMRVRHPGWPPLPPRDFYMQEIERKWSGISRCC